MRAMIGLNLVAKLPKRNVDIRDQKLTGFLIRCRRSGTHSYLVSLGRGRLKTLGPVRSMTPDAARTAADALLSGISRKALALQVEDAFLAAHDARAQARRELHAARPTRRLTWRQFLTEHYGPWVLENRKTGDETIARLTVLFSAWNDLPLTALDGFSIERWRTARLKAGRTPATVNRDLAALRGALTWAGKLLKAHPMADVKAAKIDPTAHNRYLTDAEETRLLAALDARDARRRQERDRANDWRRARGYPEWPPFGTFTDHVSPIVRLALHTGCRRGELLGLTWQEIDFTQALLTVRAEHSKSGLARKTPLNAEALRVLTAWRPADVTRAAPVFPGADGTPLQGLKTAWGGLLKAAKIKRLRFHDLRHCFASKLVMLGVPLHTVATLLGHADPKMSMRYSHLQPGHTAAAVAKLVNA